MKRKRELRALAREPEIWNKPHELVVVGPSALRDGLVDDTALQLARERVRREEKRAHRAGREAEHAGFPAAGNAPGRVCRALAPAVETETRGRHERSPRG